MSLLGLVLGLTGCNLPLDEENPSNPVNAVDDQLNNPAIVTEPLDQAAVIGSELLYPDDLVYIGAFRLPASTAEFGWGWGGAALTFSPDGDPTGEADGFPGSLFGTGHDWFQQISEVSIPAPMISAGKQVEDLPTARTLQDFQDLHGNLFPHLDYEIGRVGLEYLAPQGEQSSGKLYFTWSQHMLEDEYSLTHGWAETDLSNMQTAGPWYLDAFSNYATSDYIFTISAEWAARYTPGMRLVTGRYRDGGWGGQGPSLFAFGPWNQGNPPEQGTRLQAAPLLLYGSSYDQSPDKMENYHDSDEWNGGAWLTAGERSAVIFAGTKGVGECWYGFANGVVWPQEAPFPEVPEAPFDERGWWSTEFTAQILFYSPDDLARVALGQLEPHQPQPYAILDVSELLYNHSALQQKYLLGAAAYDRTNNLLYVLELFGDGEQPLVHVWGVGEAK
ncbi:MAG: hypothetical protein ABFS17_04420 [Chloroflexota bacterium]